jgi:hypothetical protein
VVAQAHCCCWLKNDVVESRAPRRSFSNGRRGDGGQVRGSWRRRTAMKVVGKYSTAAGW